jgi:lipoprotein-anchoring transpeptidase ErfK/SrfK
MSRSPRQLLWALLVPCLAVPAAARPWKPHPIKVIPGVPLRAEDIKPYTPPDLPPEPALEPTEVKTVEVTVPEANVQIRPFSSPLVGNAAQGARLRVRGVVSGRGCRLWYALDPFGYVCNREVKPTDQPPTSEQVLKVRDGERLPFRYVIVLVKEGEKVPMWASFDALKQGLEPERQLERGDTVAIERPLNFDGEKYWLSVEGKVLPQKGASMMGPGSAWQGLVLDDKTPLPFGWITPEKANAYEAIPETAKTPATAQLERRTRVKIEEEQTVGKKRWLKVSVVAPPPTAASPPPSPSMTGSQPPVPGPQSPVSPSASLWISADVVNEVALLPRPPSVPADIDRWIDVDLGEQVLVLYEQDRPVFATLVSSGRAIPTPMGTYPVWAKVGAITMKNQPYEDKGYFVNKVPWSTFFQWHNAIHGAYWHDKFGVTKSHGCVNVAPLDARHVFEWVSPQLPPGWTGLRPLDLLKSPYVVVRNSHAKKPFRQDRPIGPPDKELEGQRLEEANKRRADEAAAATSPAAPTDPAQAPPAP